MDYLTNDTDLKKVADAIRAKGNTTDSLAYPDGFVTAIGNIQAGGGSVAESDITFYDYEGTIVESWTLSELANKTALPAYPSHEGLICQGWNWTLADLKSTNRKMNVGAMYITDDGKTRIYIHLEEGRTSPMLGCCPNGTVTVDWGDGTTPDILTGTSTSIDDGLIWTPTHNYADPGDYVIKLTVEGTVALLGEWRSNLKSAILRYSAGADARNAVYQNTVRKVEIGSGIAIIGMYAFSYCSSLASISIPNSITRIEAASFMECANLSSITIPDGATYDGSQCFESCGSLASISFPNGGALVGGSLFSRCYSVSSVAIPDGVTVIRSAAFNGCLSLPTVSIPTSVIDIKSNAFYGCRSLTSVGIPAGVTSILAQTFSGCSGVAFYDFSNHTAVPTLANTNAFTGIAADCEIRVPAALVDEWKAATNWATYADHIVGV